MHWFGLVPLTLLPPYGCQGVYIWKLFSRTEVWSRNLLTDEQLGWGPLDLMTLRFSSSPKILYFCDVPKQRPSELYFPHLKLRLVLGKEKDSRLW